MKNLEVSSADVIEQLDELTKDMDCEVTTDTSASDMTSLMGSGLTINVKGNNLDKLQELAGEVAKVVENTREPWMWMMDLTIRHRLSPFL